MSDTIAAIATPPGEGGLHVLRISGPQAFPIAARLFHAKSGSSPDDIEIQHVTYGILRHPETGRLLDEVLLTRFAAPHSYTAEDVIEISCHGGWLIAERIFQALQELGARPARPGEFSRRAFLNGRLDLTQAEAVADLIHAASDQALDQALAHLQGGLSDRLHVLYQQLLAVLAQLETAIDFPEEGLEFKQKEKLAQELGSSQHEIKTLVDSYRDGKIVRDGLKVVLAGKPNVGKSSLLNALLKEDRAIVTAHPGTTRDVLEERIRIRDRHITLLDTAGLRQHTHEIEEEGMRRTRRSLEQADLAVIVLDASQELSDEDRQVVETVGDMRKLWVLNKSDLPGRLKPETDLPDPRNDPMISISALQGSGLEQLTDALYSASQLHRNPTEGILITRERHRAALQQTTEALQNAIRSLLEDRSEDLVAVDLNTALAHLGGILGKEFADDLLDRIFDDFCIGK